ncbi:MAG: dinitrogenase iron-molybdenum cofactor biosynthesis protein [Xanthomonadales bacterium]|nr:dinitrogenase iron-molybdenum cofactor biosynthesis protein [Gammaproteobacteria bacterium]MBT8075644.1 dinitrogenase iron-molybdenum cofactor biosynthesis protein [Gammaproteobacteria bacterium]NNK05494.1 dinitrogenase iron-molybdenum cofactor biosynthesis protein [Xanthomonadales bacterium]
MKIAVVTDDKQTISQHFGRAEHYIVVLSDEKQILERKTLPKAVKNHAKHRRGRQDEQEQMRGKGTGQRAHKQHEDMFKDIGDCDIVMSRGMGRGAYSGLERLGIQPIITDIPDIEDAVQAVLDGTIINHTEKLR